VFSFELAMLAEDLSGALSSRAFENERLGNVIATLGLGGECLNVVVGEDDARFSVIDDTPLL
jgi:hypothetical protein